MRNQLDNNKPDIPNQLTDQSQFDDSSKDDYTNYQWNYTKFELKIDDPHKSNGGKDVSAHSWWHRDEGKAQTASILVKLQIKKGRYNVASGYGVVKPSPRKTRKPAVNVRTSCIPSMRTYFVEQSPKERLTIKLLSLEVPLQVLFALTATLKATAHT